MMWSVLNKSLARNLKLANLLLIQNPFHSGNLIKHLTYLRYNCPSNIFKFSTTQQISAHKKYKSLEQVYDDYKVNHNKLNTQQHFDYFIKVFNRQQKIDENNQAWNKMNQYILQELNGYSYNQICRILRQLANANINSNLKKSAQQLAFKQIHLANLDNLGQLLTNLNISLRQGFLQLNSQTQEKYIKIYDRFQQIFKNIKQKSTQKSSKFQKQQQSKGFDFNQFPLLLNQSVNSAKFEQGNLKMRVNFYMRLCSQMMDANIKSEPILQYLVNNPFMNIKAKQSLAKLRKDKLQKLLLYIEKNIQMSKNLKVSSTNFPKFKKILKQIIKDKEKLIKQQKIVSEVK